MSDLACPNCGAELDLATVFTHDADSRALARLVALSVPLGARVLQYVALFTPAKQRLTARKKIKLILALLPDLERRAITHKGRDVPAPLTAWAAAIDQMLAARDAGRLELPMSGHRYLYAVLAGMADKHAAHAEQQRTQTARAGRRDTVAVHGAPIAIGAALAAVGSDRDLALAKLDADARRAAPMPDAVRAQLRALRGREATATPESKTRKGEAQ